MNHPIRRKKSFIKTNQHGFFIESIKNTGVMVKKIWYTPLDLAKDKIIHLINRNLVSIYLRGSVNNGTQIKSISDIDFIVVVKEYINEKLRLRLLKDLSKIHKQYKFFTKFDLMFIRLDDVNKSQCRALIKLTSSIIYGLDIKRLIPDLRPGQDICVTIPTLQKDIDNLFSNNIYTNKEMCIWIMKRVLRSGAEIVSIKTHLYSRDLYSCYYIFSKIFPEYRKIMYQCLKMAIYPSSKKEDIYRLLKIIGPALINEARSAKLI